MDKLNSCGNARFYPISNAMYIANMMSTEQEMLHWQQKVVQSRQGFSHFTGWMLAKKLVDELEFDLVRQSYNFEPKQDLRQP